MNHRAATAALLLWAVPNLVGAQAQPPLLLLGEGRDQVMHKWEVARPAWRAQPKWTPAAGSPPPLAMAQAVATGEDWLRRRYPGLGKLTVNQVTVRLPAESSDDGHEGWFYRIEYRPLAADRRVSGDRHVAVILFDGTVVVPRAEPWPPAR